MGNCLRSNRVMAQDEPYLLPSPANSPPVEAKKFEDKPAGGSVNDSFTAMGNCLKSNEVMAQDELYLPSPNSTEAMKVEDKPAGGSAMAKPRSGARGKKVVRFKLQEDENSGGGDQVIGRSGADEGAGAGTTGGGVLRIKVVVSQKELKRILKERENNSSTLEELIAELKVKGRTSTISDARTDEVEDENGSNRLALKSIPEDLH